MLADQPPPAEGAPCEGEGKRCEYDACDHQGIGGAECRDGAWKLEEWSCNPPFIAECPAEQPEDGSPCDLPSG